MSRQWWTSEVENHFTIHDRVKALIESSLIIPKRIGLTAIGCKHVKTPVCGWFGRNRNRNKKGSDHAINSTNARKKALCAGRRLRLAEHALLASRVANPLLRSRQTPL